MVKAELIGSLRENRNIKGVLRKALNEDLSRDLFRRILMRFGGLAPEPYATLVDSNRWLFFLFSTAGLLIYAFLTLGAALLVAAQIESIAYSFLAGYFILGCSIAILFYLFNKVEKLLDRAEGLFVASGHHWLDERLEFEDFF